jgi:glycosyltransferase involved in cell wall biosynthesis
VRVVALLAVHDEERFVGGCIEHLAAHGVDTYLIDNESTDSTVAIAERYEGRGLVGIETFPRDGSYPWLGLLARKGELAATLDADWFIHVDADEIRLPPRPGLSLAEALEEADRDGFNAVNFLELAFVPTLEHPDHDHPRYLETMRWYYAYLPRLPDRLNAWRRQEAPVDLASSGGHVVDFPGLRACPVPFLMRHYLFLSVEHAIRKYVERDYDEAEVEAGLHRRRAALRAEDISLRPEAELRTYVSDGLLDTSDPRATHPLFAGAGTGSQA